ncbi:MAG TPA: FecR domain-containing protein, partial [Polyangiaceae bacterium]
MNKNDSRLPVEVEPLAEARVAKLRQQVLATIEAESRRQTTWVGDAGAGRGRRGYVVALVAAAMVAAVAAFFGRAWLERPQSAEARLVTTESASQFTIGESSLDVAPRSTVLVHGDDAHGIDVVLDRGAVTCEVAPRRGRPAFVVDAGEVRVRVVGTRFTVERDGGGALVRVDHGVVEVSSRGAVTTLHDGDRWPSPPAAPAVA